MSKLNVVCNASSFDEFYTPEYAVKPILKYLNKDLIYYEPTDFGSSRITKVLRDNGFNVITNNSFNVDFLIYEPSFHYDVIITNPPFSKKDLFIERCFYLNKPFLLLMPLTALEGVKRSSLFKKFGIELIIFDRRINFLNSGSNWFNCSWFCHNICNHQLNFEELIIDKKEHILEFSGFEERNLFNIDLE